MAEEVVKDFMLPQNVLVDSFIRVVNSMKRGGTGNENLPPLDFWDEFWKK